MRIRTLRSAVQEIKQACNSAGQRRSVFFFITGAGISCPPLPLAADIIEHCKQKISEADRSSPTGDDKVMDAYSHWFEAAYPNRKERQEYMRGLIEQASISHANFRLAHLLLNKSITNLVVTPNFDDLLSRALTMFGRSHITCDNPATVERIDTETNDVQLVHVHGSYWFYDCCNLRGEIVDRSERNINTNTTMASLLDQILANRSPLVIGYSGWEDDVIMSALHRRLERPLPYNLYWFCFRETDAERLPSWLRDNRDVVIVTPSKTGVPASNWTLGTAQQSSTLRMSHSSEVKALPNKAETEHTLPAQQVLDTFIEAFELEAPDLTTDPLNFFVRQLQKSLPEASPGLMVGGDDIYFVRSVMARVERARQREIETTQKIEATLESMRDAVRRSLYDEAYQKAVSIETTDLNTKQIAVDLVQVLAQILGRLSANPMNEIQCDELIITTCDILIGFGVSDISSLLVLSSHALTQKIDMLDALDRSEETIELYDEVLNRASRVDAPELRALYLLTLTNKAISCSNLGRHDEALKIFDEVIDSCSSDPNPEIVSRLVVATVDKGVTLLRVNKAIPAIQLFTDVVNRFGDTSDPKLQIQVVVALINKARSYKALGLLEDEMQVYDEVVEKYGDVEVVAVKRRVVVALINKGISLCDTGQHREAVEVYDWIIKMVGDSPHAELLEVVAEALVNKGNALSDLGEKPKALNEYQKVIYRSSAPSIALANAMYNKARMLLDMGLIEEALVTYDDLIRSYADEENLEGQELAAASLIQKGLALSNLEHTQTREINAYDELVKRYENRTDTVLRIHVANALMNKCAALASNNPTEALDVYEDLQRRFSAAHEPEIQLILSGDPS